MTLSADFWENRYRNCQTGWDIGYASEAITHYAGQLPRKDLKILIPGAGNAYEAAWLHEKGFQDVTIIDIAPTPIQNFRERMPGFPEEHLVNADFFEHQEHYDLILEQTFFCALLPEQRPDYVRKMHELLKPGGKLVGVLFNFPNTGEGPPFGGSEAEYRSLFEPWFHKRVLAPCYNSIKPRQGNELFFIFEKKQE
ncbi:methyltransferase [Robertkochia sediminum]|uniref:methyltransferase n=1 Tax=Robertkochia sediminum TaxID=2785326 RepID=UPI0019328CEB|nr:methyltransferase [Robertkochia sediminum]MBL7472515.1 methyltransferase domain-containing protein [Robertkochia sediminum]